MQHAVRLTAADDARAATPAGAARTASAASTASEARTTRAASTAILQLGLLTCVLSEIAAASIGEASGQASISVEVRQVITMMAADLAYPWAVGDLAARVGLSASQLHRRFVSQIGVAPIQWLVRTRAEKAAALLASTDTTVSSIGRAVGWPDPNYASRRFRSVYQMTPSAYRARFAFPSQPCRARVGSWSGVRALNR